MFNVLMFNDLPRLHFTLVEEEYEGSGEEGSGESQEGDHRSAQDDGH